MYITRSNLEPNHRKRNSKIPKGQNSEDRQDHGQQNETKYKHRTHTTLHIYIEKIKLGNTNTTKTRKISSASEW